MGINTQFLDWFSIAHLVFGLALGYFYKKNWRWALIWMVGWELLEYFVLPHICCADFWIEKPINIFGDVVVGLLGCAVGGGTGKTLRRSKKPSSPLLRSVWRAWQKPSVDGMTPRS